MITVIAGGMYSEKTTELQRRGKRLQRAGKRVVFIKPEMDNRYSENEVVTHDGNSVESINMPTTDPEKLFEIANEYDVFCIDEIQFFDAKIVEILNSFACHGREIIVAGLDLAHDGSLFTVTASLMGYAETVVKINAVCATCGDDAWITEKVGGSEELVELGSDEIYKPICRRCYSFKQMEAAGVLNQEGDQTNAVQE